MNWKSIFTFFGSGRFERLVLGSALASFCFIPLVMEAGMFRSEMEARTWSAAKAEVKDVSLAYARRKRAQCRLVCTYEFNVAGSSYSGTRVDFRNGNDGSCAEVRKRYEAIRTAKESRQPVTCFYNPENPQESVLFRVVDRSTQSKTGLWCLSFAVLWILACHHLPTTGARGGRIRIIRRDANYFLDAMTLTIAGLILIALHPKPESVPFAACATAGVICSFLSVRRLKFVDGDPGTR